MPREIRQIPLTLYLEPTLWALHQQAVKQSNQGSSSSYLRELLVTDMKKRGILTPEIMLGMYEGTNMDILTGTAPDIIPTPSGTGANGDTGTGSW